MGKYLITIELLAPKSISDKLHGNLCTLGYQINVQHVLFFFQKFSKIKNFPKPKSWNFAVFSNAI